MRVLVCLAGLLAIGLVAAPAVAADRGVTVIGDDVLSGSAMKSTPDVRLVRARQITDTAAMEIPTDCSACGTRSCAPAPRNPCCFTQGKPCGDPCDWKFDASFFLWLPGMTGDVTVRGRTVEVDSTPLDVFDVLDKVEFIFAGQIRAYRGPWSLQLGGMTMTLGDSIDAQERNASVGLEMEMTLLQFDVGYCLGKDRMSCGGDRTYEVYAGARSFDLTASIDPSRLPGVSATQDFVDPLIGGRIKWDPCSKWSFDLEADIGGFGVGSDFSWSARAAAEYSFNRVFSMELGMKVLDIDYTNGSGASLFVWDVTMWGPYVLFRFAF